MTEHLDTGPYFDRNGRPITLEEYERLRADPLYRVVASDAEGELRVSTVWMGTDLSFGGCMSLESCVFRGRELVAGPDRYMDDREALEGHARLCREHLGREPVSVPRCNDCGRHLIPVLDFGRPGETRPCRCSRAADAP